ncbi:MAG: RNA-binding S4 domain-containing protein [Lachnospiraceae bacterium]|nr:RNA-binding S4 domain-containing protein [Lachnospiraceae bacterium]MBR3507549.1 RNA-binding S4 domain-containing protein [Lachnospiraceae bacterium]MBR4606975.1 RNA-binding S4 domain-containing protein [Lachnospiraceae bacterium]MBR6151958.1 RNA-binding S4 domain-containing protein [Lachnospiraceae bacterium]
MEVVRIKDEFIKLGQVLKLAGLVESGVDAKLVIQDGLVKVNGEIDTRRGRKIVAGDIVEYQGSKVKVEQKA